MYRLSLQREFSARHYLIGGDWGAENRLHSHPYRMEWLLEGDALDAHGYLVDLVEVERLLDEQVARVRDQTLNDLPEFAGLNPSLEHFARLVAQNLTSGLSPAHLTSIEVRIWESDTAWAGFRMGLP